VGDLSAHFSTSEFRDHVTGEVHVVPELVRCLELLRHEIGDKPIVIISGYRSPSTNRAVGGAPNSQHLYGRAADISATLGVHWDVARRAGFTGVGIDRKGNVVHVDVRPGPVAIFLDAPTG